MEAPSNVEKGHQAANSSGTWRNWLFSKENDHENDAETNAEPSKNAASSLSESFVRKSGTFFGGILESNGDKKHKKSAARRRRKSLSLSMSKSAGSSSFASSSNGRGGRSHSSDSEESHASTSSHASSSASIQDRGHAEMEAEGLLWEAQVGRAQCVTASCVGKLISSSIVATDGTHLT
jgi:hypothetical protein